MKNILVIGSGGREHAITWKLSKSPLAGKIYCVPGNAGISKIAECARLNIGNNNEIAQFAEKISADLTIVGPELPLCNGIVDTFRQRGLPVFGPSMEAARLEGSKVFSKIFMKKYGIPTADAEFFTDEKNACKYVHEKMKKGSRGVVVKADGLASGKGVSVAFSENTAFEAIKECLGGAFGEAGKTVLIEDLLEGEEASILALTDGKAIVSLASSQDHKRAGDGDTGPNTGGMGAYSPAAVVSEDLSNKIKDKVLMPFLKGINYENLDYRGIIYAGVMIHKNDIKVLEFNVRFGDPETQAILIRLKSDLVDAVLATMNRELHRVQLDWTNDSSVCVVMASKGYPGPYKKGFPISGLDDAEKNGAMVFHAGTSFDPQGHIVNAGGRVLGVTVSGNNISDAIRKAYDSVKKIHWENAFYRNDIGYLALKRHSK